MATLEQATAALGALRDAGSGRSLLELGWIEQPRLQGDRLVFRLSLPSFAQSQQGRIASEARDAVLSLDGISDVQLAALVSLLGDALAQRNATALPH